jgi:hypothetical protein
MNMALTVMAKNPSIDVLKRWRDMDNLLSGPGLHIPSFALKWKVTVETVYRDKKAFRALGQRMEYPQRATPGRPWRYRWYYERGVKCLFVSNLPPSDEPDE